MNRTAPTAPSGAHRQAWRFVAVDDPDIERRLRIAAVQEKDRSSEGGRVPPEWLEALAPLGTDWHKPSFEIVPWIVVACEEVSGIDACCRRRMNSSVKGSVDVACGLFIAAIHRMGLATLTHTPSAIGFLSRILGRPQNEWPSLLFPAGYPAPDAELSALGRKALQDISVWNLRPGDATASVGPGQFAAARRLIGEPVAAQTSEVVA